MILSAQLNSSRDVAGSVCLSSRTPLRYAGFVYSAALLDHFQHPRNAGTLEHADVSVEVQNPACGDILKLMLKLADRRIVAAKFQAKGCVAAMACASALTELLSGKSATEARAINNQQIIDAVGGLTPESMHASHLAIDAAQAALAKLST